MKIYYIYSIYIHIYIYWKKSIQSLVVLLWHFRFKKTGFEIKNKTFIFLKILSKTYFKYIIPIQSCTNRYILIVVFSFKPWDIFHAKAHCPPTSQLVSGKLYVSHGCQCKRELFICNAYTRIKVFFAFMQLPQLLYFFFSSCVDWRIWSFS